MAAEINSVIGTKSQSGCRLCAGVVDNVRKCWYYGIVTGPQLS